MDGILTALWPLFALLLLGYLGRRLDFPGAAFWPPAERATYYVLFPALLVSRLSRAELGGAQSLQLIVAVVAMLVIASLLVLLLRPVLRQNNAAFTSVYQGGLRFNTYVALPASAALVPQQGVVLAALLAAVMIPLLNLFCVLVFAWYGSARPTPGGVLPAPAVPVLDLLAAMALPLGLLAVGAALDLRALRTGGVAVIAAALVKLVLMPLLAWGLARGIGLDQQATQVLLVFAAVPTATSAYILARQLGGDAPLMANIITAQTLIALLTMPLMLGWLG
jgi:predicted permease